MVKKNLPLRTWQEVHHLENLRRAAESAARHSGMTADYLDLGRPDEIQRLAAEESMRSDLALFAEYQDQLVRALKSARKHSPQAVETWVRLHLTVCDWILCESPAEHHDHNTRSYLAEQTLAAWKRVQKGEQSYVSTNASFLDDYDALFDKALLKAGRVKM
ncbi:MAG: hypothetical protein JW726_12810 [Anaerolineales bacterium]|nr:hypothetical protein [Anaerolineales bacterium]